LKLFAATEILKFMIKVKKPSHLPALVAVTIATSIKTLWLLSIPSNFTLMENDSVRYLRISEHFWSVFFHSNPNADSFYITPGYPLFLSFFPSENIKLMIFFQLLLLGASQIILFKLIIRHTSTGVAYIGLTLFILESSTGLESFNLLTETLFNFIFVLFLFLFEDGMNKKHVLYTSGIVLGIALIVRPVGQILLIPLILMIAFRSWRRQVITVLLIAVVVSSTWIMRNQVVFGVPQLSGIQSLNLLQYEGAGASAKQNDVTLKEAQAEESTLEINQIGEGASIQKVVEYRVDRGIKLIIENLSGFFKLHLEGAVKILLGPGSANIRKLTSHFLSSEALSNLVQVLIVLMRLVISSLAFIFIFLAIKKRVFMPIQFYSIVSWILLLISSGGANAYSRFRVPLIPLEIIIICIGLWHSFQQDWFKKIVIRVKRAF